jgi:hypothetical protein
MSDEAEPGSMDAKAAQAPSPLDDAIAAVATDENAPTVDEIQDLFDSLPGSIPAAAIERVLGPFLDALANRSRLVQEAYLKELKAKCGLSLGVLRAMLKMKRHDVLRGEVAAAEEGYRDLASSQFVSTFTIQLDRRIRIEGGQELLDAVLRNQVRNRSQRVMLPPRALQSKRAFFDHVQGADYHWTGTDENLQAVAKDLAEFEVPVVNGTKTIGYVASPAGPRWVAPGAVISERGLNGDSDIICVDPHRSLAERLRYPSASDAQVRAVACEVLPVLVRLNAPKVVLPVLAWFAATVFKAQLHQGDGTLSDPVRLRYQGLRQDHAGSAVLASVRYRNRRPILRR